VVHDPKPPLHRHNWLSFGKFQDTERFLIHYERHFSSQLPPNGGTCKYAKAPSKKKLGEILYLLICSFLPCLSWLLRSRVRKSRKGLWITLYIYIYIYINKYTHTYIIYMCVCVYFYKFVCVYVFAYVCMYVCTMLVWVYKQEGDPHIRG